MLGPLSRSVGLAIVFAAPLSCSVGLAVVVAGAVAVAAARTVGVGVFALLACWVFAFL